MCFITTQPQPDSQANLTLVIDGLNTYVDGHSGNKFWQRTQKKSILWKKLVLLNLGRRTPVFKYCIGRTTTFEISLCLSNACFTYSFSLSLSLMHTHLHPQIFMWQSNTNNPSINSAKTDKSPSEQIGWHHPHSSYSSIKWPPSRSCLLRRYGACWVRLHLHNPPCSDRDHGIFNIWIRSFGVIKFSFLTEICLIVLNTKAHKRDVLQIHLCSQQKFIIRGTSPLDCNPLALLLQFQTVITWITTVFNCSWTLIWPPSSTLVQCWADRHIQLRSNESFAELVTCCYSCAENKEY